MNLIPSPQGSQSHLGSPWLQLVGPPAGSCLGCFGSSDASSGSLMMGVGVVFHERRKNSRDKPITSRELAWSEGELEENLCVLSFSSISSIWRPPQVPEKS